MATLETANRGAPLVATWMRWFAAAAALVVAWVVVVEAYVALSHAKWTLFSAPAIVPAVCGGLAVLLWATLRAEELRLARELRIARTGTSVLRATVTQRRQHVPLLARLLSTKLGMAAVLLADGDRLDARDALSSDSPLMRGGRLEKLRVVVDADIERSSGASAGLGRCVQMLQAMSRIGNREADLYCLHVLVKALLEQGDAPGAVELARKLEDSRDDEERVYLVWLRVWFDLDGGAQSGDGSGPPLSDGELRMAMLLARAHGADKLVEKLEGRVVAIARPTEGE
jgi:hypothetical protein